LKLIMIFSLFEKGKLRYFTILQIDFLWKIPEKIGIDFLCF